jgi:hypothetical protein
LSSDDGADGGGGGGGGDIAGAGVADPSKPGSGSGKSAEWRDRARRPDSPHSAPGSPAWPADDSAGPLECRPRRSDGEDGGSPMVGERCDDLSRDGALS